METTYTNPIGQTIRFALALLAATAIGATLATIITPGPCPTEDSARCAHYAGENGQSFINLGTTDQPKQITVPGPIANAIANTNN